MLIGLSVSFLVLNFPYFVVLLVSFIVISKSEKERGQDFDKKPIIYFTLVEILQLVHYSISGFILFLSGKLFRINLSYLKKIITCS